MWASRLYGDKGVLVRAFVSILLLCVLDPCVQLIFSVYGTLNIILRRGFTIARIISGNRSKYPTVKISTDKISKFIS